MVAKLGNADFGNSTKLLLILAIRLFGRIYIYKALYFCHTTFIAKQRINFIGNNKTFICTFYYKCIDTVENEMLVTKRNFT